jgi:hypothetical protein
MITRFVLNGLGGKVWIVVGILLAVAVLVPASNLLLPVLIQSIKRKALQEKMLRKWFSNRSNLCSRTLFWRANWE